MEHQLLEDMRAEIMIIGTAEEKRIAAMPIEELRQIHKYGSYHLVNINDPPNLNRFRVYVQEILEQQLEQKAEANRVFIERYGQKFVDTIEDYADQHYFYDFPDADFIPYLYQETLEYYHRKLPPSHGSI